MKQTSVYEGLQNCKFQRVQEICLLKNFLKNRWSLIDKKNKITFSYLFLDNLTAMNRLGSNQIVNY